MSQLENKPQPVPDNSRDLVRILKLRLTTAIIDGKASDAKTYVDVLERISKLAWLDDLTPVERSEQDRANYARLTQEMNGYIADWLVKNPLN
jgi:hypothetical protein